MKYKREDEIVGRPKLVWELFIDKISVDNKYKSSVVHGDSVTVPKEANLNYLRTEVVKASDKFWAAKLWTYLKTTQPDTAHNVNSIYNAHAVHRANRYFTGKSSARRATINSSMNLPEVLFKIVYSGGNGCSPQDVLNCGGIDETTRLAIIRCWNFLTELWKSDNKLDSLVAAYMLDLAKEEIKKPKVQPSPGQGPLDDPSGHPRHGNLYDNSQNSDDSQNKSGGPADPNSNAGSAAGDCCDPLEAKARQMAEKTQRDFEALERAEEAKRIERGRSIALGKCKQYTVCDVPLKKTMPNMPFDLGNLQLVCRPTHKRHLNGLVSNDTWRINLGKMDVFRKHKSQDVRLVVIQDGSGSMNNEKGIFAGKLMATIEEHFDVAEKLIFDGNKYLYRIPPGLMCTWGDGGTPLCWAFEYLAKKLMNKQLVAVIITDGEPNEDSIEHIKILKPRLKAMNAKFVCVTLGYGDYRYRELLGAEIVNVFNVDCPSPKDVAECLSAVKRIVGG